MSEKNEHILSPAKAAELLGKSRPFIISLIRSGQLEATDERGPGSRQARYVITREACIRWRESRRVTPVIDAPAESHRREKVTGLMQRRRERRAAIRARQAAAHGR